MIYNNINNINNINNTNMPLIFYPNKFNNIVIDDLVNYNKINDYSKLYIDKYYLIVFETTIKCCKLIKHYINDYCINIYFYGGNAYYNTPILEEMIYQYHIQGNNICNIRIKFYDYHLDKKIQKQIILYCKIKILNIICNKKNIPDDIILYIIKYL